MTDDEIVYQIRGSIYDVYTTLGPDLLESVYEESLAYELKQKGLKVERQKEVPLIYKEVKLYTNLRLDMLVEDRIIIELKAVSDMQPVFYKQILTYLRLTNLDSGILVNFDVDDILTNMRRVYKGGKS